MHMDEIAIFARYIFFIYLLHFKMHVLCIFPFFTQTDRWQLGALEIVFLSDAALYLRAQ